VHPIVLGLDVLLSSTPPKIRVLENSIFSQIPEKGPAGSSLVSRHVAELWKAFTANKSQLQRDEK
jgi:hypothetical protein